MILSKCQFFRQVLAKLYENRKIAQATHNIYAYRIYKEDSKSWLQDCDDDGETQAGSRLLHLLQVVILCFVCAITYKHKYFLLKSKGIPDNFFFMVALIAAS